ncbi:PTS glucose transporter subunit IIA [Romboutsia weinsteinii]|uniref:PTS glucose transporter subunit IIA n=1 Tax=Romboutsia weinsteinii TaxID=2020949 RepID=A0A371J0G9_9FIRM|nr:PTS glucose transporter subunit IIA [Romboutsia weinsteinii]RDY26225.1 PTS glucose transporter subunit IIA [Romboutsia weinsteinii]
MLSIFKKKKIDNSLSAFTSGRVIPIEELKDGVFSSKVLGDGLAIYSENDEVVSPGDGEVVTVMNTTKHAVGIKMKSGVEILLHVGIDTVSMQGEGFNLFVDEGDKVKKGDKLITFNSELIKQKGLIDAVVMVATNSDEFNNIKYNTNIDAISKETVIAEI